MVVNPERRQSLDEFFAQAEDVLTDWAGSPDAMNTGADSDRLAWAERFLGHRLQLLAEETALTMQGPTVEELAVAWRERYLAEQRLMANVIHSARNWLTITGI